MLQKNNFKRNWWFISAIAILIILGASCSSYLIKTAYNWADTYFYGKVQDMFELDDEQKKFVKKEIKAIISWHRKNGLPQIEDDLRKFREKVEKKLTISDIKWLEEKTEAVFSQIAKRVLPSAIEFLTTLRKEQILFFKEQFEDDLRELKEKQKENWELRQKKEFKKLFNRLESIYGDFSEAQKNAIFAYFKRIPDYLAEDIENKKNRHSEFHFFMLGRPAKPAIAKKITPWVIRWRENLKPDLRQKMDAATKARFDMFYQVDRLLTDKQRQHGLEKIQEYINIVVELQQSS